MLLSMQLLMDGMGTADVSPLLPEGVEAVEIATFLKNYLRELPEPILTFKCAPFCRFKEQTLKTISMVSVSACAYACAAAY